ncbi:hypothetical protein [Planotetraspora phitsanulokensis]|nr:hypothetical protein [Planotetraspora phitsanulokensis]
MSDEPEPPGKRYRLRGLVAVTLMGIASWAFIIWVIVKLFS